jgi:hypothetical protein
VKALALVVLLVPAQAAADCALLGLAPKVLTAPDAKLSVDGGIVVGAVSVDRGALENGDAAVQANWKFVGPRPMPPTIDVLAPGLAVYRSAYVQLELQNESGDTVAKAARSNATPDLLAAPKIKTLRFDAPMSRRSIQRVEVTLDGAAPAGVIALVLADTQGTPKSWGPAVGSVLYPYLQRDCLVLPNGTVPSKKGDKVTLFWIDEHGRKSAPTKPLAIK